MKERRFHLPRTRRALAVIGGLVAVLVIVFTVPYTRYGILGQFFKKPATIEVVDSQMHKPISNVTVMVGRAGYTTDAHGQIKLAALPVGGWPVTVNKRYYNLLNTSIMQPLFGSPKTFTLTLVAIGNQITVKVVNKITQKPLSKAEIKALGTTATTDPDGMTTLVLPTGKPSVPGTVSLNGYNDQAVTITNTETDASANTFGLVPTGKIYYLDKRTGVINVMRANLDGTNPEVVVAGTGKESDTQTVLLASRDWKYLALQATRDSKLAKLYAIDAGTGHMDVMDEGDASFTPIGWDGDYFVYQVGRTGQYDQPGVVSIKSYNAASGHLTTLFTNGQAAGGAPAATTDDVENVLINGKTVVFTREAQFNYPTQPTVSFMSVQPDGSNLKSLKDITPMFNASISARPYSPDEVAYQINVWPSQTQLFLELDNDTITQKPSVNSVFNADYYPTYLLSPSGNATFWYDQRDGKNTLFTGDASGGHAKTLAALSDFTPFGWYTDDYLLLSKNKSELYIVDAGWTHDPVKITDYHKPAVVFNGYGGGYGGQ